uniref:Uncharacterized protein n=1 Tax=Panagrolaimus superbus TaxID=310955 RepID=A0A914XZS0_9BILA
MDSEFSSSLPLSLWTADTSSQQKTPNPLIPGPSKIEASASESEENGKVETLDILNQVQEDSALNDEDLNYLYSSKTSGNPATTTIQVIDNLDIDKNIIEDEIPIK